MRKSVHTRAYKVLCERLVAARKAAGLTQHELEDWNKHPASVPWRQVREALKHDPDAALPAN